MKEIAESTTDDEEILFETLYLNDELQQIVSKYKELEAAQRPVAQEPPNVDTAKHDAEAVQSPIELPKRFEEDESEEFEAAQKLERKLPKKSNGVEANVTNGEGHHVETTILDEAHEKDNAESKVPSQTLAFFNGSLILATNLPHSLFLALRYLTSFNTGIGPDPFTSAAATAAVGFRAATPLPLPIPMALVFNIKKSNLVMS
ncbi:target of Myb protein [Arachis hypogaea]|nr:target of Myb protein [Arachis hypogaea]